MTTLSIKEKIRNRRVNVVKRCQTAEFVLMSTFQTYKQKNELTPFLATTASARAALLEVEQVVEEPVEQNLN